MEKFSFDPLGDGASRVNALIHSQSPEATPFIRPAIVVCPGGAYSFTSDREADPVAEVFYAAGYNTFVLRYSCGEWAKNFKPLIELAATVSHIRSNAMQWLINPDQIAVCGFSAGGHLAASLGTLFNDEQFLKVCPPLSNFRPDAMILGYPVLLANEFAHYNSIATVSGQASVESEAYRYFGLNCHVDSETPPAFLWHTAEDNAVPVENSLSFAAALSACKVPFELHIFPTGVHGMSVCNKTVGTYSPYNGRWIEWCVKWLGQLFAFVA